MKLRVEYEPLKVTAPPQKKADNGKLGKPKKRKLKKQSDFIAFCAELIPEELSMPMEVVPILQELEGFISSRSLSKDELKMAMGLYQQLTNLLSLLTLEEEIIYRVADAQSDLSNYLEEMMPEAPRGVQIDRKAIVEHLNGVAMSVKKGNQNA